MDAVGKVDRCGAVRQILDITGWRKAKYHIRKEVEITFQQAHELLVVRHVSLPLQDLAQPTQLFFFFVDRGTLATLLIFPMRSNTIFGSPVHIISTDLYFKRCTCRSDQSRVQ